MVSSPLAYFRGSKLSPIRRHASKEASARTAIVEEAPMHSYVPTGARRSGPARRAAPAAPAGARRPWKCPARPRPHISCTERRTLRRSLRKWATPRTTTWYYRLHPPRAWHVRELLPPLRVRSSAAAYIPESGPKSDEYGLKYYLLLVSYFILYFWSSPYYIEKNKP